MPSNDKSTKNSQQKIIEIIDGITINEGYKLPYEAFQPLVFMASSFLGNEDASRLFRTNKVLYETSKGIRAAMLADMLGCKSNDSKNQIVNVYNKVVNNKFGYYTNVPPAYSEKLDARILEECLRAVALGEEKLAKALLELRPECLLEDTVDISKEFNTGNPVVAYSGKTFEKLTPFQIALCEGDVAMAEMMIPFFKELTKWEEQELPNGKIKKVKLFDGEAEMQKQFNAIFPNGDVNKVMKQLEKSANRSKLIDNIFAAIKNAPDNEVRAILNKDYANAGNLGNILDKFKSDFDELSNSEKIFNPYHLLKAFQKYYDNYVNFGEWNSNKNNLAWRRVVGFVQCYLPACSLQDFAYGIYDIAYEKVARQYLPRSLEFWLNTGFFMVSRCGDSVLGVDYAGGAQLEYECGGSAAAGRRDMAAQIMSNKNFRLGQIYQEKRQTQTRVQSLCCVVL